ncbi:MAG: ATP-binding cassette domain-containing protein [bacterium]|nr:ATP-binding cassette domain-containing protein [bacterium]
MLKVQNLYKTFEQKKKEKIEAVRDVSFNVNPGEVYGLLGPNGAGKTTILRMISTLLKPTRGEIFVKEFNTKDSSLDVKRNLGFLSGSTALYDRLTAEEMVKYFGNLFGLEKQILNQRIEEIFSLLKMNEFRNIRCGKLSTGMKQKVSIARTLINDPPLLVLDEPTAGLDVLSAKNIIDFIKRSRDKGKAIIFSTHIMSEAEYLCDRVGILHKGKIYYEGTLSEIKQKSKVEHLQDIFFLLEEQESEKTPA